MPPPNRRILFIMGMGRSGSSLLARVLGQMDGLVNVGELRYLWRFGVLSEEACTCGQPFTACAFWKPILAAAGIKASQAESLEAIRQRFDRLRSFVGVGAFEDIDSRYNEAIRDLLESLFDMSEARVIVDASKSPAFGYFLNQVLGFDVHFLHLVRDARAVAYSSQNTKADSESERQLRRLSAPGAAAHWLALNLASERVIRLTDSPYSRLQYEDFARAPQIAVDQILSALNEPTSPATLWKHGDGGGTRIWLGDQHAVGGNPGLRRPTDEVMIRPDLRWQLHSRPLDRWLVTTLAWPGLQRYGYLRRGEDTT